MITFNRIRWKNFLKTGNYFNEIILDEQPITLIYGRNGSGKSTAIEAMIFALFGKSYRGITKNQLINSINGGSTLVEIEFSINSKKYKVIRGIKPNIFEIYENDTLIDLSSNSRDYQEKLNQLLGVNMNVFTQTVTVGSSSYVPFMKLAQKDRRLFVESVLDLDIFTEMSKLAKTRTNEFDDLLSVNLSEISKFQSLVSDLSDSIQKMQESSHEKIKSLQAEIESEREQAHTIASDVKSLKAELEANKEQANELSVHVDRINVIKSEISKIISDANSKAQVIKKIMSQDHCPTCHAKIPEDEKEEKISRLKDEISPLMKAKKSYQDELDSISYYMDEFTQIGSKVSEIESSIRDRVSKIEGITKYIKRIQDTISSFKVDNNVEELIGKVKGYKSQLSVLETQRENLRVNIKNYKTIISILKDDGAKRDIVNQYIPLFNEIVNEHLTHFEFFVEFELDEEFNETIKSRYRDQFSYYNFSEGERSRIDFSILFAWRRIAQMKNSFETNLMFCDELFDSAMDEDGNSKILELLSKYSSNAIIISHNSQMNEMISDSIEFYDEAGFSYMKQGER